MKLSKNQIITLISISAILFGLKCTSQEDMDPTAPILQQDPSQQMETVTDSSPKKPKVILKEGTVKHALPTHSAKKRKEIKKSATKLTSRFNDFKKPTFRKEDFVSFLKRQGLEPEVNIDETEGLEDLSIIRTSNTLKGIRYIHAQFTGESEESEILQHLSFELRPSKTAFKDAQVLLAESFPELDDPLEDTAENMVIYKHEGYVVWIKQLDEDDVSSDPFNPRTVSEDTGSVKIAIEFDIHPDFDDGHDHGHDH